MNLRRKADVIARREGNKTLIFQANSRDLLILNPTSTFIWELVEEAEPAAIAELLEDRFELPAELRERQAALALVDSHLELLTKANLLERAV